MGHGGEMEPLPPLPFPGVVALSHMCGSTRPTPIWKSVTCVGCGCPPSSGIVLLGARALAERWVAKVYEPPTDASGAALSDTAATLASSST